MSQENPIEKARELLDAGRARRAVRIARAYARQVPSDWSAAMNLGGVLIDAGSDLRKPALIREGVRLLEKHADDCSSNFAAQVQYDLGTGYLGLGQLERGMSVGTRPSLSEAVSHLNDSLEKKDNVDTRVNLAAALIEQGRYVEVADELDLVLIEEPDHHVALAHRAHACVMTHDCSIGHSPLLLAALEYYRRAARAAQGIPSYRCRYEELSEWMHTRIAAARIPETQEEQTRRPTRVEKWIWDNQLALNMCPHCRKKTPDAFDTAIVKSFLAGGVRRPPLEDTFDLLDSLCRSFGTARWCLLQGVGVVKIRHSGLVLNLSNTGNSANNIETGLAIAALSGFYSILDQIGFALNSYLHLGHDEMYVSFAKVWNPKGSKSKQTPKHRKDIHPHLRRLASPALSALYRLALSFEHGGGLYEDLRKLRNKLEHRVLVPTARTRSSDYFTTESPSSLAANALRIGRIAKAAILYFGAAVWKAELERTKRAQKSGMLKQGSQVLRVRRV